MRLETKRLLIRPFTAADFPDLWEILGDPAAMEHMASYTREEAEALLRTFCLEREPPGACAAVLRDTGKVIGWLLCNEVDSPGIYELGWIFNRACWRRGYAFEAGSALMDHLFRVRGAHKVAAETMDEERCLPLLEKLGLRREGVFRRHCRSRSGQWRDLYWYGLLAEDYLAERGQS